MGDSYMGPIIAKRALLYVKLLKSVTPDKRVYSRDMKHCGIIIAEATPYHGEAGYSSRVRVLWSTGRTTLCCYKGLIDWNDSLLIL